jgi:soluble lytic murein transglycosylase-like protein
MRLMRTFFAAMALIALPVIARADYLVLRSGARMNVSSYELLGEKYRVQIDGGWAEILASEVVAIEPEEIFVASPKLPLDQARFGELIRKAAQKYAMDADLLYSVIAAESNFNPRAVSRRRACGLMQLLPETAKRLGVKDIYDPAENIEAGTHYLRDLLKQYQGDLALTLAAYNAGPGTVQRYGRVPPYNETIAYIRAIRKTYAQRKSAQEPLTNSSGR